jgi:hypothetical protein
VEKQLVAIGYSSVPPNVFACKVAKTGTKVALQIIRGKQNGLSRVRERSIFFPLPFLSFLRLLFFVTSCRLEKLIIFLQLSLTRNLGQIIGLDSKVALATV